MDEPILIKLYTVAVYDLRMCLKEDNCSLKYVKGDHFKNINSCAGWYHFVIVNGE